MGDSTEPTLPAAAQARLDLAKQLVTLTDIEASMSLRAYDRRAARAKGQ